MSTLTPSPPSSPTTIAFFAWLNCPPSSVPKPVPLTSRQFFPSPTPPNSFNHIILSPDSTPPSPSSTRVTETSTPPLSPIKEVPEDEQEPPEVDVLIRLYENQPNCPEHVLRNLRKIWWNNYWSLILIHMAEGESGGGVQKKCCLNWIGVGKYERFFKNN